MIPILRINDLRLDIEPDRDMAFEKLLLHVEGSPGIGLERDLPIWGIQARRRSNHNQGESFIDGTYSD